MTITAPPSATSPVAPCPACGAWSVPATADRATLFDVCNTLVLNALSVLGRKITRQPRARFQVLDGRPWHVAHTLWRPDPKHVDSTLENAWNVLPALLPPSHSDALGLTAEQVSTCLDEYVLLLLERSLEHDATSLRYWLAARLGLTLPETAV